MTKNHKLRYKGRLIGKWKIHVENSVVWNLSGLYSNPYGKNPHNNNCGMVYILSEDRDLFIYQTFSWVL
jgi:hypothetical protein